MEKRPFVGDLDRRIKIFAQTITQSTTGAEKTTETQVCEPWAKMEDVSGNESVDGKVIHLVNRTYTVRWRDDLKEVQKMIVRDGEERFEVTHKISIGRKGYYKLICKLYE